ncbi:MAG: DUF4136 domain-containing protein [Planctomycetota bacterium]
MLMFRFKKAAALVAALPLAACSSVAVDAVGSDALRATDARTYAWVDGTLPGELAGRSIEDPAVLSSFRDAFDAELAERGYERVEAARADLAASLEVRVVDSIRRNDPYFAVHPVERVEHGRVTLALREPQGGEVLWSAAGEQTLRVTERGMGHTDVVVTPVDEEREWEFERFASAVVGRVPPR